MKNLTRSFLLAIVALHALTALASQFHVSSTASSSGNGSKSSPWTLQTALNHPTAVKPGDTIWLHAGLYKGNFKSQLNGAAGKPILVRQYPGERATIDGGNSQQEDILRINGSYVWYWGFEVLSSDPVRSTPESGSFPSPGTMGRGTCINTTQDYPTLGNKFINLVIHDGFNGFGAWVPAGTELYGSILYNNGWNAPDRPHGHNIYVQNTLGEERKFIANIVWGAYENNVQAYGTRYTDDFYFEKNAIFAHSGDGRNLLIGGGGGQARNPVVISNYLYDPSKDRNLDFGWDPYGSGVDNGKVQGNYMMGGGMYVQGPITNTTIAQNTIYAPGGYVGFSTSTFPNNTYITTPTGVQVDVIPNAYEPGRGNIVVFNWNKSSAVSVDLSGILSVGDNFELRDAQNLYGTPVASGKYAGGTLSIKMTGLTAVSPVGDPGTRTHTAPQFAAFIVTRNGGFTTDASPATAPGLPEGYSLEQNYPNPFNPTTEIHFTLPEGGRVSLAVFNSVGQEVARPVDAVLTPGEHAVSFDASRLASGVYFYRMMTERFVQTRKMVLMR